MRACNISDSLVLWSHTRWHRHYECVSSTQRDKLFSLYKQHQPFSSATVHVCPLKESELTGGAKTLFGLGG